MSFRGMGINDHEANIPSKESSVAQDAIRVNGSEPLRFIPYFRVFLREEILEHLNALLTIYTVPELNGVRYEYSYMCRSYPVLNDLRERLYNHRVYVGITIEGCKCRSLA